MKKWYLQWEATILFLFRIGSLKLKNIGKTVWIGMNRKPNEQVISPEIRASARNAIKNDVSWKVRYHWWKQDHSLFAKYGIKLSLFMITILTGLPIIMGGTFVEIEATGSPYAGSADYDPQVNANSKGEVCCIYGVTGGGPPKRISMKYSLDGGTTWEDRITLFSHVGEDDGIIDSDYGGMWEFSSLIKHDMFYVVFHLRTAVPVVKMGFTKCDVSDMSNLALYSKWRSANNIPVPSEGNGTDGNGYDIISGDTTIDPSLAVRGPDDIAVVSLETLSDDMVISYWNGSTWDEDNVIETGTFAVVPMVRVNNKGEFIVCCPVTEADTFNYILVIKCANGVDPTVEANWTKMDGTAGFDYALDQGTNSDKMQWGNPVVDANGNYHIVAVNNLTISSFKRVFYNWHDGDSWQNGSAENNAGSQIDVSDRPRIQSNAPRYVAINADSAGNLIMLCSERNTTSTRSYIWDKDTQTWGSMVIEDSGVVRSEMVGEYYARSGTAISRFFTKGGDAALSYLGITDGVESGDPWWAPDEQNSLILGRAITVKGNPAPS